MQCTFCGHSGTDVCSQDDEEGEDRRDGCVRRRDTTKVFETETALELCAA